MATDFTTDLDFKKFLPEQQDEILGGMQQQALKDYRAAASITERSAAVTAFADAGKVRAELQPVIQERATAKAKREQWIETQKNIVKWEQERKENWAQERLRIQAARRPVPTHDAKPDSNPPSPAG